MILLQHLSESPDTLAGALLLRQLSHFYLSEVAFYGLFEELLTAGLLRLGDPKITARSTAAPNLVSIKASLVCDAKPTHALSIRFHRTTQIFEGRP